MWRRASALVCSLALLLPTRPAAAEDHLAVIVAPQREVNLTVEEVAQIYLRKRRFWGPRDPVVPVNREAESATRAVFTRAVFGREARWLATYWNRQYFHGVLPPATLASQEAVKRFVACEPHAIGYIDAGAVDDSVRVVLHLRVP